MPAPDFHNRLHQGLQSVANAAAASDYAEAAAKLAVLSAEAFAFSRIKRGAIVHFHHGPGPPARGAAVRAMARALRQAAKSGREIEVHTRDGRLRGRAVPSSVAVLGARWEGAAK